MGEWHDKDDALTTARKRAKWDADAAAIALAQDHIAGLETALHELVAAIEAQPIVPSARLIQAVRTAKQQ